MITKITPSVVKGALKAIELFKVVFDVNKNVIISQDNQLHINNTELLICEQHFADNEFQFGFNFVIEQIEKYREKLCINPVLYLLFLEQLFSRYTGEHFANFKHEIQQLKDYIYYFLYI